MGYNIWGDVSSIAQSIQNDAYLVVREVGFMQSLVTVFNDASGANTRKSYKYNKTGAMPQVSDGDDLNSDSFTPSADQTLTPYEYGKQIFVSDLRQESEAPESIMSDSARELGLNALETVEGHLIGDFTSLTGGTVGTTNTAITWDRVASAIAIARNASKSIYIPLAVVIHGFQAKTLMSSASVAGATTVAATNVADELTRQGLSMAFKFDGCPIYQTFADANSSGDFVGAVFPKSALAIDWRRAIRIEAARDASRRGVELNMSAVYAHGVWRAELGVQILSDCATPA